LGIIGAAILSAVSDAAQSVSNVAMRAVKTTLGPRGRHLALFATDTVTFGGCNFDCISNTAVTYGIFGSADVTGSDGTIRTQYLAAPLVPIIEVADTTAASTGDGALPLVASVDYYQDLQDATLWHQYDDNPLAFVFLDKNSDGQYVETGVSWTAT